MRADVGGFTLRPNAPVHARVLLYRLDRPVVGGVVADHELEIGEVLGQNGFDAAPDDLPVVSHCEPDGEDGRMISRCLHLSTNAVAPVRTLVNGARVLVTGSTGMIGTHVLRVLPREAEVVAVSRAPRAGCGGRARWRVCDLTQPGAAADLVASVRPDIIIHLAGAVRGDRSLEAVGPTLHANLVATVELLEAATRASCPRIVLSGSQLEEPAAGGHDAVPPSPYGASRWASSAYGRMFHAVFGTPVVILRPQYVYGPGQRTTFLIPHVIKALLEGRRPQLSTGERMLDCVYAEDVARAYVAAAEAPGLEKKHRHRQRSPDFGAQDRGTDRRVRRGRYRAAVSARCRSARWSSWWRRMSMRPPEYSDGGRRPDWRRACAERSSGIEARSSRELHRPRVDMRSQEN